MQYIPSPTHPQLAMEAKLDQLLMSGQVHMEGDSPANTLVQNYYVLYKRSNT